MGNIVLLDDLTINKIAAGEVIERPASVIKEMVENSIDAGATNITVEIKNGGISYIRVTDNGKGIAEDDMEMSFERHATSKIRSADDLSTVMSMGFRGEALASIAAIARVEMVSKTADAQNGYKVVVEGGSVLEKTETGAAKGTTITVTNLFYNTPVRYKFLRKDFTEAGYIEDAITRIALVHPEIAIKLINSGKVVIQTNGNGDLKTVIYSIYGKDVADALIETDYIYEDMHIYGVIGKPEIARSNRANQIFFVNKRYIKDKSLSAAAEKAYKGMIPIGKFSFLVLNVDMNPSKVDVNVHPAKLEVRFEDENQVFKALYHAIKDSLLKAELVADTETPTSGMRESSGLFGRGVINDVGPRPTFSRIPQIADSTKVMPTIDEAKLEEIRKQLEAIKEKAVHEISKENENAEQPQVEEISTTNEELKVEEPKTEDITETIQNVDVEIEEPTRVMPVIEDSTSEETTKVIPVIQTETETQPEAQPTILEQIYAERTMELKEDEIPYALQKKENQETTNKVEFDEMYMKLFGTKPVKEEIKDESDKSDLKDIAKLENMSVFDRIEQYNKPAYKFIGIVFKTYIIIEMDQEMYIIDQHAAHERILYEKVKKNYYSQEYKDTQMLLLPDIITLTHKEMEIAKDNMQMFRRAGFEIEEFGENTIKLIGVPEMCIDLETKEMFLETLDEINSVARTAKQEIEERFIATVACKAAVKANMALTKEEVDSLMDKLLELPNPFTCPHGRPTAIKMSKYDIERKFARK